MSYLAFYANHSLDFKNSVFDKLENNVITRLSKINIPDDILLDKLESLRKQFPDEDLSKFYEIKDWCTFSFPDDIRGHDIDIPRKNVALIGQMGLHIVFTPNHILLPSGIEESADWYSPNNKEIVQVWRTYYFEIIKQFGGDHALYVGEQEAFFYYDFTEDLTLQGFEKALEARYGPSNKSIFDYSHGEFPEYYIDTFEDIKSS